MNQNPECPYCGKRHRGNPIVKAIRCELHWQNRELWAIMKAERTLLRLEYPEYYPSHNTQEADK
jgi:hypothetical protein